MRPAVAFRSSYTKIPNRRGTRKSLTSSKKVLQLFWASRDGRDPKWMFLGYAFVFAMVAIEQQSIDNAQTAVEILQNGRS